MKIAVCSSGGNNIDTHFGKADSFKVYELSGSKLNMLSTYEVVPYCRGYEDKDHDADVNKLKQIYAMLKDCTVLFTLKIGEAPRRILEGMGLEIVECEYEMPLESIPGMIK